MTVYIPLDWIDEHKEWLIAAGILLYYLGAGIIINVLRKHTKLIGPDDLPGLWIMSPMFLITPAIIVIIAAIFVIWTFLWALSCGAVECPWKITK